MVPFYVNALWPILSVTREPAFLKKWRQIRFVEKLLFTKSLIKIVAPDYKRIVVLIVFLMAATQIYLVIKKKRYRNMGKNCAHRKFDYETDIRGRLLVQTDIVIRGDIKTNISDKNLT